MINFNFKIELPIDRWGNIKYFSGSTPFPNKYWEFNINRCSEIISFEFSWNIGTQASRIEIWVGLFGYALQFMFYDNRNWDSNNNCYEV